MTDRKKPSRDARVRNVYGHDAMNMRARAELRRRGASDDALQGRLMTDLTGAPRRFVNAQANSPGRLPSQVSRRDFTDVAADQYRDREELTPAERRARDRVAILSGALQRRDGRAAFSRAEGGSVKKMAKGGKAKKMAKGGTASKRADGCATKGKTKGRMV